jgi:hypothetical protein
MGTPKSYSREWPDSRKTEKVAEPEESFAGGGPIVIEELPVGKSIVWSEDLSDVLQFIRKYPDSTLKDLAKLCEIEECPIYHYLEALSKAGISICFREK